MTSLKIRGRFEFRRSHDRFCHALYLVSYGFYLVSPGPSDIATGIEWNRMRPEAKALLGKVGTQWLLFFMSLSYSSTPICWATIWEHYGRKA